MSERHTAHNWNSDVPDLPVSIREVLNVSEPTHWDAGKTVAIDLSQLQTDEIGRDALVQMAIEHAADGIAIITPPDPVRGPRAKYVNQSFTRITGMASDDALGGPLTIFGVGQSDEALLDAMMHPLCQRRSFEAEAEAVRANGTSYLLRLLLVPIHHDEDESSVRLWVAYLRDVSEERAQVQTLEHQATHDDLTGLPNRSLLFNRLGGAIERARELGEKTGLLIMDLDRFKEVNDTFGHHYGDVLLNEVARRLRDEVDDTQTIARMGGDEFALVVPIMSDPGEAIRIARKMTNALEYPFEVEQYRFEVGASVGIAVYPDHGEDASTLLRRADAAMYKAKREGIGFSLFTADLEKEDPASMSLAVELREAIRNRSLEMFYQPKVHLRTGVVVGVEALARWRRRDGYILPDVFIRLAEKTGMIGSLTEWAIDCVLDQCATWKKLGKPLSVAVNVSGRSFHEHILPQKIFDKLQRLGLEPQLFKLEITESNILADPPQALAILSLLRSLGIRISLDDFGTGYSSLTHLRQLPVDEIKIDKSFVMGMASSEADAAIVRAMVDLAHSLGRQVVAEGVADANLCRRVAEIGVDVAQGYCFTPPLPPSRLEEWLEETSWGKDSWERNMRPGSSQDSVFD